MKAKEVKENITAEAIKSVVEVQASASKELAKAATENSTENLRTAVKNAKEVADLRVKNAELLAALNDARAENARIMKTVTLTTVEREEYGAYSDEPSKITRRRLELDLKDEKLKDLVDEKAREKIEELTTELHKKEDYILSLKVRLDNKEIGIKKLEADIIAANEKAVVNLRECRKDAKNDVRKQVYEVKAQVRTLFAEVNEEINNFRIIERAIRSNPLYYRLKKRLEKTKKNLDELEARLNSVIYTAT
jgi:hypothetical protein